MAVPTMKMENIEVKKRDDGLVLLVQENPDDPDSVIILHPGQIETLIEWIRTVTK